MTLTVTLQVILTTRLVRTFAAYQQLRRGKWPKNVNRIPVTTEVLGCCEVLLTAFDITGVPNVSSGAAAGENVNHTLIPQPVAR